LITDNGSSHRGRRAANRLRTKWPNIILVHTPLHASWLNQIEVYFSIVQRKVLNPNDFSTPAALKSTLMRFSNAMRNPQSPLNGPSRAVIFTTCSPSSAHNPIVSSHERCPKIRHRIYESEHLGGQTVFNFKPPVFRQFQLVVDRSDPLLFCSGKGVLQ
jgi:hypothetical protein